MKSISNEKFKLCDLVTTTSKEGKVYYKAIVYSTLTQNCSNIFTTKERFEELLLLMDNSDCSQYFERVYNDYDKSFVIKNKI